MRTTLIAKIIDIALTLVACVLIIVALIWFVHTFDVFELPEFVERFFENDNPTDDVYNEFDNNLLALIEAQPYINGDYEYIKLTPDKALQLLSSVTVEENFYWEVKTTVTHSSDSRTQLHKIYKSGDSVRIDTSEEEIDFTTIYKDGNTITVNNTTDDVASFGDDTDFSYTSIINIAALEQVLASNKTVVNDIAIVEMNDMKYLYTEIPKQDINGIDKLFISLDHGVVLNASSSLNGTEYFSQSTISFDSESIISDKAFDINLSETAEPLRVQ